MGQINKGTIASISGTTARVVPSDAGGKPTAKIVIPWHLREDAGKLSKGMAVVYAEFDDNTGLLLGRADGEWGAFLPSLKVEGDVIANARGDGVSLRGHKHTDSAGGSTSAPT